MRVTINLEFANSSHTVLPMEMNHILQGFIYSNLPESSAKKLHDSGFPYEKRRLKMFTFSRLMGIIINDPDAKQAKKLRFERDVSLVISSPIAWLMRDIASELLKKDSVCLVNSKLYVKSVSIERPPEFESEHFIKFISPVTLYSTFEDFNGKKKTLYYKPYDEEFSRQIESNAQKKYEIVNKISARDKKLYIEPIKAREHIVKYKGFIIKAWDGKYRICGSKELIEIVYNAGAGSKNSQGFGSFVLLQRR